MKDGIILTLGVIGVFASRAFYMDYGGTSEQAALAAAVGHDVICTVMVVLSVADHLGILSFLGSK